MSLTIEINVFNGKIVAIDLNAKTILFTKNRHVFHWEDMFVEKYLVEMFKSGEKCKIVTYNREDIIREVHSINMDTKKWRKQHETHTNRRK